MPELIEYMKKNNFFESPASTRFHGNYPGGLAEHSWNVYEMYDTLCNIFVCDVPRESRIICGILHDLCKINQYIPIEKKYEWNKGNPKGHATLSVQRIKQFIELTPFEELTILHHMGVYGSSEWNTQSWQHPEYSLKAVMEVFHGNNKAFLFYIADHLCAAFKEKTAEQKEAEKNEFETKNI